jgi:hypothetical protein
MDTRRWERFAPLTGVLFVLLTVAGIVIGLSDSPDDFPAKVDDIVQYYQDDPGKIMLGSWLGLLGGFFLIWFAGSVRARLRDAGEERLGTIAFGGAVAAATAGFLIDAANFTAAMRADEDDKIDPAVATTLYDLANSLVGTALPTAIAVFVAATGVAALRSGVLPRWLGIVSLVLAVTLLIFFIAWFMTAVALLWALLVSILLYRAEPAVPVAATAVATPGGPPSG